MEPSITIFWIDVNDDEAAILDRVARAHHARLVPIKAYALAPLSSAALAQGAVVYVARTAQEATRALGLGVDEVIRLGEIGEDALTATLARARARAEGRIAHLQRRSAPQDDDERALSALSAAFARQLSMPLGSASMDCELLDSALSGVLDVSDRFVEATIRRAPIEQFQDLAVRRLALPPTHDLKRLVAEVRADVQRARATVVTLLALASRASGDGGTAAHLVEEIVAILRPEFAAWAAVTMKMDGACRLNLPPVTVAFALSALMVHAADAVRSSRREGGRIEVRLAEREDAVVLEVQDNGGPVSSDLRPTLFEPYFQNGRTSRTGVALVRERISRGGGEVTVDSGESGTTVRVVLPAKALVRPESAVVAKSELPKKPDLQ